nr:hypothetical protein [Neorhizobium vignae]
MLFHILEHGSKCVNCRFFEFRASLEANDRVGGDTGYAVADAYLLIVLMRLKNFALLFVCLTLVVGQTEKHAFLVPHERGPLVDVMNDLVQPTKGSVIADQQNTVMVFQQAIG